MWGFDFPDRSQTYITLQADARQAGLLGYRRNIGAKPMVEIRFDSKIVLNGEYLVRLSFSQSEITNLFYLMHAGSSLEKLVDEFRAARQLQEHGPLPQVPFDPVMLKRADDLDLSMRTGSCLKDAKIVYVGDLVQKTEVEMLRVPNFGRKSLNEIKEVLAQMSLQLGMEVPEWPPENLKALAKDFEDLD